MMANAHPRRILPEQRQVPDVQISSENLPPGLHGSTRDDQVELATVKLIERPHRQIKPLVALNLAAAEKGSSD